MRHYNKLELLERLVHVVCVFGTIGAAVKFAVFWDRWVYFPLFPNIYDSIFLVFSVVYLSWRVLKKEKR